MADPLYVLTDAIDADSNLPASEKVRRKANLKAAGIRDDLLSKWTFPRTFNFSKSGHAYVVTITSVTVRSVVAADRLTRDLLSIAGGATRDGARLAHFDGTPLFPIEIYNPPVLIAGGGGVVRGGRAFTYDLAALAQSVLGDVVAGV